MASEKSGLAGPAISMVCCISVGRTNLAVDPSRHADLTYPHKEQIKCSMHVGKPLGIRAAKLSGLSGAICNAAMRNGFSKTLLLGFACECINFP
jgi:hypothetical protein